MKLLDSLPLTNKFLAEYIENWESEPQEKQSLIGQLISGCITIEKPSPNKIHQELVQG